MGWPRGVAAGVAAALLNECVGKRAKTKQWGPKADAAFSWHFCIEVKIKLNSGTTCKQYRSPTPKIKKKINRATQQDVLLFVSRSGASTPRNRREAASRCRCTAERSTQAQGRQRWRQGIPFQICVFLRTKHHCFPVRKPKPKKVLHRPGIEPGSVPWQGTILPLDHRCT